jgi:hypothetical protein
VSLTEIALKAHEEDVNCKDVVTRRDKHDLLLEWMEGNMDTEHTLPHI